MKAVLKLLLFGCLMCLATATLHANLIQNGSFESPVEPTTGIFPGTPTNWNGGAFIFQGSNSGWPSPQDGIQFDDIGNGFSNSALSQTVPISTTGFYTLSWFDNCFLSATSTYQLLLNGTIVNTYGVVGSATWHSESIVLSLNSGVNTIMFQGLGGSDSLLDNVSLNAPAGVPDTGSTLGLLLLSLIVLFGAKRVCSLRVA